MRAGLTLGSSLFFEEPVCARSGVLQKKTEKFVVITFGGGRARDSRDILPRRGKENIPNLLKELIPAVELFHAGGESRNSRTLRGYRQVFATGGLRDHQ